MYINDKNSSRLREFLTVSMAGYNHTEEKIGYNGYKHIAPDKPLWCEAKPKNFSTREIERFKQGQRSTFPQKLNGGGNFSDYTWNRLKKDLGENLQMLVSGFVDGKLIYILEFPFRCKGFVENLERQLKSQFPRGDEPSRFLRSANFNFKDYVDCEGLRVVFVLKKAELSRFRECIAKDFYKYLQANAPE
jgi:hypothetical protein